MNGVERFRAPPGPAGAMRLVALLTVLVAGAVSLAFSPALAQTQAKPASASPAQAPEAVVRALYQHYLDTKTDSIVAFDYTDPEVAKAYFDPSLIKLIVADAKRDTTRLDFDPFVDGQEFEIRSVSYETKMSSQREAMVSASFDNFDQATVVTYKLGRTSSGWRITDVLWAGGRGTLRKLLSSPTS